MPSENLPGASMNIKWRKNISHLLDKSCDSSGDDMKASVGIFLINKRTG